MYSLLWLIPLLPLVGFLLLVFFGRGMPRALAGTIGAGSVGLSALVTVVEGITFLSAPPAAGFYSERLWSWVALRGFTIDVGFRFDALTLTMMAIITVVGFLIHLYSTEFMAEDGEFALFFAYMNLFVASMLLLVMADNLLVLYLGWEGVGLCSYLLIGFWYRDPENGAAARKAFIVTRIGDVAMLIGFAVIVANLGTLNIQELMQRASGEWAVGSALPILVAALLLGGAIGKSAQVPLQVWLPDAMAGPTPVSALIHAATMVTAGVYLIARTHVLYALAPPVQLAVAMIGLVTLLVAGFSAIAQVDLKRVLAYSTVSQIGYMFLGLGVGFYSAAMLHFMVHAFFKALLFLGAGAVMLAQNDEHNMFKMGGLRRSMPLTFVTFLIGVASLSALPVVTAGFYSKEWILSGVWQSPHDGPLMWLLAGGLGVLLTSIYSFRALFVVFFGRQKIQTTHRPGVAIALPLVILAALSIGGGFVQFPPTIAKVTLFQSFIGPVFHGSGGATAGAAAATGASSSAAASAGASAAPASSAAAGAATAAVSAAGSGAAAPSGGPPEALLQIIASALSLIGVGIAYLLYRRGLPQQARLAEPAGFRGLRRFLFSGLGFDWLDALLLVNPFLAVARFLKGDFIEYLYSAIGAVNSGAGRLLASAQSGKVRWYLAGLALGAVVAVGLVVWL